MKLAGYNILERDFSTALVDGNDTPLFFNPSHTPQFSINNCLPLRIHPPWHPSHAQSPKTCWGNLQLPPLVTTFLPKPFLSPTFDTLITPPKLAHTSRAHSMLSLPLSYAYVINHTELYIETIVLCLPLETPLPSSPRILLSNLPTARKFYPIRHSHFNFISAQLSTIWHSTYPTLCSLTPNTILLNLLAAHDILHTPYLA